MKIEDYYRNQLETFFRKPTKEVNIPKDDLEKEDMRTYEGETAEIE